MRVDVILEASNSASRVAELARLAERYGFGGVWVSNMHDARDPFINFVEAARTTTRINIGPVAVSPYELHPMKMAASLLTLNDLSGGRGQIGVAAGSGGAPSAMGVPATRRLRAVRECVEILKKAATGKPLQYKGEIYKVLYYHPSWAADAPPPMVWVCANGPQMVRSAAKYADGIYTGDHLPHHSARVCTVVKEVMAAEGRPADSMRFNNFWAWHVKPTRAEAHAEARKWLAIRATPYREYYHHDILEPDEMEIVFNNTKSIIQAFNKQTDVIENIPAGIMERLVDRTTSASAIGDLDREIERLLEFRKAGLTDISLRIYANPEASIKLIGERVIPVV
mgnify:CR=1 FL=1